MRWLFGGGSLRERLGNGLSTEEQRRVQEYREADLQEASLAHRDAVHQDTRQAGLNNDPLHAPNVDEPLVRTGEDIAIRSQAPLKA